MIVWMEDDSYDLALSFQDKAGCDDLWTKICEVRVSSRVQHLLGTVCPLLFTC